MEASGANGTICTRLAALLVFLFASSPALALAADPVTISAAPLLGREAPTDGGWFPYLVRLDNQTADPVRGRVNLIVRGQPVASAPVALAGHTEATVQLSWHQLTGGRLAVEAVDSDGERLALAHVEGPRPKEPFLLDLKVPSRMLTLSGHSVATGYSPPTTYPGNSAELVVRSPFVDGATGDLNLPIRPSAYGSVTVVHAPSDRLATLDALHLTALSDWVLTGGTLAVSVTRPEDLRGEPLSSMIGAPAMRVPPPPQVLTANVFVAATSEGDRPGAPPTTTTRRIDPDPRVLAELDGFVGGNLRPTRWGATATYGLGEVHLLSFDATSTSTGHDAWVDATVVDLVRHAWDRQAHLVMASGSVPSGAYALGEVLRMLDPNEGGTWSVLAAAVLLIAYALFSGPVLFFRARKRGRPLAVLWQLPLAAFVALVFVISLGVSAKGTEGRARRLTLADAGAGVERARATRFRAFYTPSAERLTVHATDRSNLLDVVATEDLDGRRLVLDRDGARLEGFVTRPWETRLVREDGLIDLGGGVSVVDMAGDVSITNRTGRALIGVLVRGPDRAARYFQRIDDGERVRASGGEALRTDPLKTPTRGLVIMPLQLGSLSRRLDQASKGLGAAWAALGQLAPNADFWPADVPVLIAQLEGGEGKPTDAGLTIESDRLLLRVVGYGGLP